MQTQIKQSYDIAQQRYAEIGVDTDAAIKILLEVPLSLPCWQGDDVRGFENMDGDLSGSGLMVTGSDRGRARNPDELRNHLLEALSLIPGTHRVNLHAMYGEFGSKKVDRDEIDPAHFTAWIEWAKDYELGLDFNATCFAHPKAAAGFTLSSPDESIRSFWIEHVRRCREIASVFGKELNSPAIHNLWIPDGFKDHPADRLSYRERLKESLDTIYKTSFEAALMKDSIESKLFGIGSEAFVTGSHDFYTAYAIQNKKIICLDMGHYHPTEQVSDKLSALLPFTDELLLHVSRGMRWDSDHVPVLDDQLRLLAEEIISCGLSRFHLALDFFDATISRTGGYVIGSRAVQKALLQALLLPRELLQQYESDGDLFARMSLRETTSFMPAGAVWDYLCYEAGVHTDINVLQVIESYEERFLG